MSTKSNVSQTPSSDLVTVRAICSINDGPASHPPGSIFEVTREDYELLLKAGAVILATDTPPVPIEEMLPAGMDASVWMADPRLKINGAPPSCFVKRSDYEALVQANR
jgi:hypothetical protein